MDRLTSFVDASVKASRPYGVRGDWLMSGRIARLYAYKQTDMSHITAKLEP